MVPETVRHFIGGKHVHSTLRKSYGVTDPATGKEYAQVEVGLGADINQAVLAAGNALETGPWPGMAAAERARILHGIADAIDARAGDIAAAEALGPGLPVTQAGEQAALASGVFRLAAELIAEQAAADACRRRASPATCGPPGRHRRADHVMAHAVPGSGPCRRARPGRGLHDRAQAGRVGAAAGRAAGGDRHRGGPARRRAQHRARLPAPQGPRRPGAGRADRPPQRGAAVVRRRRGRRTAGHARRRHAPQDACPPSWPATRPASSSPTPTWTRRSTARCSARSR